MEETHQLYLDYYTNAKKTIEVLENEIEQINLKLNSNPSNSLLLRELKNANLNLIITKNELEHVESVLERY